MKNRLALIVSGVLVVGVAGFFFWPTWYCKAAFNDYGFKVPECPTGKPRQILSLWGRDLQRGGDGELELAVQAYYTTLKADEVLQQNLTDFQVKLTIVNAAGTETPLQAQGKWKRDGASKKTSITLPPLDDGDYLLRARVTSRVGESEVDLKLALYAPARIHVLTDRPLYEPGNLVQFRALALRARDLTPIDNRPGTWIVRSPSGEVLLEEKAPAQEWGVVAGDFPLADDAEEGAWSIAWRSGANEESTSFRVEPFVLPRFRVESSPDKSYYRAGQKPRLGGAVVYSSGAPVADATLEISWSASGAWPPPSEWMAGTALPRQAKTKANGRFELELPEVPADLRGRCTLTAYISAIDPAGDRVGGSASVLLSEDSIQVSAVTELQGGLVENTNNRVYLRVTSPEGFALGGSTINVKRAWAPGDQGIDAELDADGVTRIQFDPGRPVSVVIPPMPVRKSMQVATGGVRLGSLQDLVSGERASLADQVAAERWLGTLGSCTRWVRDGSDSATISFRVSQSGVISSMTSQDSPISSCVGNLIKSKRLPVGKDRLYSASFMAEEPNLPVLDAQVTSSLSVPDDLEALVETAAVDARSCLPASFEGELPWVMFWQSRAESKKVDFGWMRDTGAGESMPNGLDKCIASSLAKLELDTEADLNSIGLIRYQLSQADEVEEHLKPQSIVMQGYELTISASNGQEILGTTKLRMSPGAVPHLRLRATPVIANPGEPVELAFFRGPEYTGSLPEEIQWSHRGDNETIELAKKAKSATFHMPKDAKGWYEFSANGARALVFVRSKEDLSVSLTPGAESYAPGASATIQIQTTIAGAGAKAAVGLFGVDDSLSQIATLRGADDLGSIRPQITMSEQAFGALDAQALSLGRIRGAHAAEATILRVESIPAPADIDVVLYESAQTQFDAIAELTDNFYIALAELHVQTRAWENAATEDETMSPKQMAKLWKQTLASCQSRGQPILDAYGRPLRLHWLPSDLLALTSPAMVVADATRLPEDVENWQQWVMEERP